MKYICILIFSIVFLNSCSSVRKSAGVTRKAIDEYAVVENPPLVIPPDFNLLDSDQLEEKNIQDLESDLAKEILFGLDESEVQNQKQLSTMSQILKNTGALEVPLSIRDDIDRDFSQEIETKGIFQVNFENEVQVLDAVKESERIRNNNFEKKSILDGEIPTKIQKIKKKKKKRFIFF